MCVYGCLCGMCVCVCVHAKKNLNGTSEGHLPFQTLVVDFPSNYRLALTAHSRNAFSMSNVHVILEFILCTPSFFFLKKE